MWKFARCLAAAGIAATGAFFVSATTATEAVASGKPQVIQISTLSRGGPNKIVANDNVRRTNGVSPTRKTGPGMVTPPKQVLNPNPKPKLNKNGRPIYVDHYDKDGSRQISRKVGGHGKKGGHNRGLTVQQLLDGEGRAGLKRVPVFNKNGTLKHYKFACELTTGPKVYCPFGLRYNALQMHRTFPKL